MPSPDVAGYVGLDLSTLDAQTLVDTALANAVEKFPDWTPREGNTEVVLIEQLAAIVEEDVYALNALPDGMTEVLLRLFGLTRDQGAPPTADVRFTIADNAGHTIPAGTTIRLDLGDTADPVDLVTTADLVIPPGATTGVVAAAGLDPTLEANGKAAGTALELLDAISYVEAVEAASTITGGRLAEEGEAFLDRAVPILSRLTTTLVRPSDVEAYVAEDASVSRVKVLDLYNPATPATPPGLAPGYVTVAVTGPAGGSIGPGARATLTAELRNRMHAGLTINVVDADVNTVDVTVTVIRYATADPAVVAANVRQAISDYLNPDTWAWANLVRVNELIATADRADGVDTVVSVTQPAGDVTLPGYAPLARAGVITVNVQDPA